MVNNNKNDIELQQENNETTAASETRTSPRRLQFMVRESLLTRVIREDTSSRAIYCIFFVVLSGFFWTRIIEYFLNEELRREHTDIVIKYMWGFDKAFCCWIVVNLVIIFVFIPIIKCSSRNKCALFTTTASAVIFLTAVTPVAKMIFGIRYLSGAALMMEQIRIQMKVLAFSIESFRQHRQNRKPSASMVSTLSSFVYFLFAPTLIYRESYPKNSSRNIFQAVVMTYELVVILSFLIPIGLWLTETASRVGLQDFTVADMFSMLYPSAVSGLLFVLLLFYGFHHLWMNIWSEILLFGDRQFYLEFWTENDPAIAYRKYNLFSSGWLFAYVFLPLRGYSPVIAWTTVTVLSGVMHEFVIAATVGYIFPIFMICSFQLIPYPLVVKCLKSRFGPIVSKYPKLGHVVLWSSYYNMWTVIVYIHILEIFSRQNCPSQIDSWWLDYFYPRTLSCLTLKGLK